MEYFLLVTIMVYKMGLVWVFRVKREGERWGVEGCKGEAVWGRRGSP